MQVDLKDDRFDVTYSPAKVNVEQLLKTVRDLGYQPKIVERKVAVTETLERVNTSALPKSLAAVFARAREAHKPVLVHFTGPG